MKIIQQDLLSYITSDKNQSLSTHKLKNCEIRYDMFSLQDCTKYVRWGIQKNEFSWEIAFTGQNNEDEWW